MTKRIFDLFFSFTLIYILFIPMVFVWVISSFDTRQNGIFIQNRIGRYGMPFRIYKFRSMGGPDFPISNWGKFIRKYKIDEWPQLFNILKGEMSFVGPRPDVPGYYDELKGNDRKVLVLKPGLTCEASIKYRNEEALLAAHENPMWFNDYVLFPDKVKMNLDYLEKQSLWVDVRILIDTLLSVI